MPTSRSLCKQLLALVAFVGALVATGPAAAQAVSGKIAGDLAQTINAPTAPASTWARSVNGQLHVKVLIVASSSDPTLAALRQSILARGGSVHYVYLSVRALSVRR